MNLFPRLVPVTIEQLDVPSGPELCEKCWHASTLLFPLAITIDNQLQHMVLYAACMDCHHEELK